MRGGDDKKKVINEVTLFHHEQSVFSIRVCDAIVSAGSFRSLLIPNDEGRSLVQSSANIAVVVLGLFRAPDGL
jgi:hypothetical protein